MRWIVGLVAMGSTFLSGCTLPAEPTTYSWPMAAPAPFLDTLEPPPPDPGLLIHQLGIGTSWEPREAIVINRPAEGDPAWRRVRNETSGFGPAVQLRLETIDYEKTFAVALFGIDSTCTPGRELEFLRARIHDGQYVLEYHTPKTYVPPPSTTDSDQPPIAACSIACTARGIAVVDRFLPGPVDVLVEERDGAVRFLANEATT